MSFTIKAIQQQQLQQKRISYNGSSMANYNASISRFDTEQSQQQQQTVNIDKKDLNEINNRLNLYFNTVNTRMSERNNFKLSFFKVKQLSEHKIYGYHNDKTFSLISSLKNFENDIDWMKKIYENEIKVLGTKIDDVSNEKSKYKLESCNLDLKLREMTQK
jgi:hypothetical protein